MMKKMLLTLTAAGMLAVPAGVALAQDDTSEPTAPVATCQDHERSQEHNRLNERDPMAVQGQERAQHQFRTNDGDCGECTGPEAREANQARVEDGTGSQVQYRSGEMGRSGNNGSGR